MPKYRCYGKVVATKYLGTFEADSPEEAEGLAAQQACVSVCHHCAKEIDDPQIEGIIVEEE